MRGLFSYSSERNQTFWELVFLSNTKLIFLIEIHVPSLVTFHLSLEGHLTESVVTFWPDLAEECVALAVSQKVHVGKHEGVSAVCTGRPAETPPLYFICRKKKKQKKEGIQGTRQGLHTSSIKLGGAPAGLLFLFGQLSFPTVKVDCLPLSEFYLYFYRSFR